MLELYLHLFVDSLFASLILPIRGEMIFNAMIVSGNYNSFIVCTIAFFASIVGLLLNFWVGKKIIFLKKTDFLKDKEIEKVETIWNKYAIWILPFAVFNSIGTVMSVFSGFFKTKIILFIVLISAGKILYYYISVMS